MINHPSLTARQRQVVDFVREYAVARGSSPTLQEIRQHFGFKSVNSAREHLRLLERKGYLARRPGHARGIQLNLPPAEIVCAPLIGRITAGEPSEAIESVEFEMALPRGLWRGDNLFALRVRGDSMVGAGIFDGDIAVVNAQSEVPDGKVAAVIIDQDATLKRVFRTAGGIRLHAENPTYSDLIFDGSRAKALCILGILVGTLRSF